MVNDVRDIEEVCPELEFEPIAEYLGVPLTLLGVEWRNGQFGDYAVIHATLSSGEQVALSAGSESVMRQLRVVEAQAAFPVRATLVKELNPRTGRHFQRLCSPDKIEGLSPEGILPRK